MDVREPPDLVRQLNRSGKLEEHLNDKLMAAYRLDKQMKEQGFAKDQIEEAVMSVLAPSDGPPSRTTRRSRSR